MDANPTTGHSWQESHDATMLKLVEETFELGESAREGLIGAGGVTKFRFKAIGKGMTKIIMVYKRPWEQEVVEQEAFAVDIK